MDTLLQASPPGLGKRDNVLKRPHFKVICCFLFFFFDRIFKSITLANNEYSRITAIWVSVKHGVGVGVGVHCSFVSFSVVLP